MAEPENQDLCIVFRFILIDFGLTFLLVYNEEFKCAVFELGKSPSIIELLIKSLVLLFV